MFITGGTGSFGHAAVRRALDGDAERVIVYSRDEVKQAALADTLPGESRMRYFLGDVRDPWRLSLAMRGVDVVLHAAALKRVEEGEYNPTEFVATNVDGTRNVLRAALDAGVHRMVTLSTDKACNPVNLYGTTKLCAEKLTQAMQAAVGRGPTRFCAVRYGNVAGSRGSVIPRWREALAAGRPVTITDPTMTRFWITLAEAVDLVEYALLHTQGGEVFVPKLSAYLVGDLAAALHPDARSGSWLPQHTLAGTRPGEKRHEALIGPDEVVYDTGAEGPYLLAPSRWASPHLVRGEPMPHGFTLTSDAAPQLDVARLRKLLESV